MDKDPSLQFGVKVFFARHQEPTVAVAGAKKNALAIPPSSHIIGRFPSLKALRHAHLCSYIDVINPKYGDRLFVISEHFPVSLKLRLDALRGDEEPRGFEEDQVRQIAFEVLLALRYLERRKIVHRNLSATNVLFSFQGRVKLADYGLYFMTDQGKHVPFPIGDMTYLAPEDIVVENLNPLHRHHSHHHKPPTTPAASSASIPANRQQLPSSSHIAASDGKKPPIIESSNPRSDTWSFGVLLFEMMTGSLPWSSQHFEEQIKFFGFEVPHEHLDHDFNLIAELANPSSKYFQLPYLSAEKRESLRKTITENHKKSIATLKRNFSRQLSRFSSELVDLLDICFDIDPLTRATPNELIMHAYFRSLLATSNDEQWSIKPFVRSSLIEIGNDLPSTSKPRAPDPLENLLLLNEIPLMRYAGDDLSEEEALSLNELFALYLHSGGDIEAFLPASLKLPAPILRLPIVVLSETGEQLSTGSRSNEDRIRLYDPNIIPIALRDIVAHFHYKEKEAGTALNPVIDKRVRRLSAKENDFAYQQKRILHFKKLLRSYPETRSRITQDARKDIPPVLRGDIWACILGVPSKEEMEKVFGAIKLDNVHASDQQGHAKLNKILKAWVRHNPDLNYWQGIDSLLAPFLVLNFTNEAKAFFCLQNMIGTYLEPFFHKDKAIYLQEHLLLFQKLLAYIDPQLANHFRNENFMPDLYAIPWFLTMFAHMFSLDQIWRMWDTVLVSPPSLPLFIAISVLEALRELLLPLDFNALILLFSSLPELNMEALMISALEYLRTTPPSLTEMVHHTATTEVSKSLGRQGRWWEESVPLEEQREEHCGRISVNDLINIKDRSFVLDIRARDEFILFQFPDSFRIADIEDTAQFEKLRKAEHIVVIGKGDKDVVTFANNLVAAELPRVALLNGGIEALITDAHAILKGKATRV